MFNFLKSRTILLNLAAALLPAFVLLGQVDLAAIITPITCGAEPTLDCINDIPLKAAAGYSLVIAMLNKVLRFMTSKPVGQKTTLLTSE